MTIPWNIVIPALASVGVIVGTVIFGKRRIDSLKEQINTLNERINTLKEQINALERRNKDLEKENQKVRDDFPEGIERRNKSVVRQLKEALEGAEKQVAEVEEEMVKEKGKLAKTEEAGKVKDERIERLTAEKYDYRGHAIRLKEQLDAFGEAAERYEGAYAGATGATGLGDLPVGIIVRGLEGFAARREAGDLPPLPTGATGPTGGAPGDIPERREAGDSPSGVEVLRQIPGPGKRALPSLESLKRKEPELKPPELRKPRKREFPGLKPPELPPRRKD